MKIALACRIVKGAEERTGGEYGNQMRRKRAQQNGEKASNEQSVHSKTRQTKETKSLRFREVGTSLMRKVKVEMREISESPTVEE